jgi:CrcB protein
MQMIAIGLGGALGAIARFLLGSAVQRMIPGSFPYGTFVVNVVGCLAFGVIVGLAESRLTVGSMARSFLLIGVLGGFTTFSSFTFENFELIRTGQTWPAMANVAGQVVLGLAALWAGLLAGRAT